MEKLKKKILLFWQRQEVINRIGNRDVCPYVILNPKSAISQCGCTDLLSCVHSRTALLCSLQPHTEMQGWHVKKNCSKMFKEYAQFLINFCRIGQVSQHSAPLDTLKAMKLVKGTAAVGIPYTDALIPSRSLDVNAEPTMQEVLSRRKWIPPIFNTRTKC